MDYEFIREPDGRLRVRMGMGHEVVGHWINDELSTHLPSIDAVLQDIAAVQAGESDYLTRTTKVYSLHLGDDEAEIVVNVLQFDFADELEPDMSYYDDEQMAGCGLDDFQRLLLAWRDFVVKESQE